MKVKNINTILLVSVILTSCAPAVTVVSPTETAVPLPTISPVPATTTTAPTLTPENVVPTGEPTAPLSAEGPWLIYVHNSPSAGFADLSPVAAEFVLLNQDGSGRTLITLPECYGQVDTFLMDGGNLVNYMAQYDGGLYLFRPSEGTGMLVYQRCKTFFSGDEKGGLLASIYQAADDAAPELIIYELPGGKIRDCFPLVRCGENAKVCNQYRTNWSQMGAQEPQWSPNGRYLAFAAVLDADSSDLFVSEDDCENDTQSFQAFDYQGNFKCVPKPAPTPDPLEAASYPSPDGIWTASVKDGLWLETDGKPPVPISQEIPTDVIWCSDSNCFFFSDFQQDQGWTLYRVSLPELTIKMVDEGIQSKGSYQWLGVEK